MSAKALYLQTLETQHLVNLISYIEVALLSEGEGLLFLTPTHDGLLVYKKNVDRYHIEQLIKLYNKEITEDSFIQFSCGKLEKKIKGVICEKTYYSFLEKLEKLETEKEKIVQADPEVLNRLEVLRYAKTKSPFTSQEALAIEVSDLNSLIIIKASKEVFGEDFFH